MTSLPFLCTHTQSFIAIQYALSHQIQIIAASEYRGEIPPEDTHLRIFSVSDEEEHIPEEFGRGTT